MEFLNQAKNIFVLLPGSATKISGKFISYDWTFKQTKKQLYKQT